MIRGVLLIPAEGDPFRLLRDGPWGARPPTALLCNADERNRPGVPGAWHPAGPPCREHPRTRALVLWAEGRVVPDGVFRAWFHTDDVAGDALGPLVGAEDPGEVIEAVMSWRRNDEPLGTLVCLDADGREVSP